MLMLYSLLLSSFFSSNFVLGSMLATKVLFFDNITKLFLFFLDYTAENMYFVYHRFFIDSEMR